MELYDAGIGQVALEVTKDIASADLAEVAVQILLQDVFGNVTLTVLSSRSENGTLANPSMRIRRDAFYRVYAQGGEVFSVEQASRDAACRQLKAWHAVRPIEDIKKQLQEDEAVERYWIVKFQILAKQLAEKFL